MKGYWKDEARTAEAFKYDWFHTGDIGTRDHLGYIHFVDREKDVLKVGGYSVFSREVEEEILRIRRSSRSRSWVCHTRQRERYPSLS